MKEANHSKLTFRSGLIRQQQEDAARRRYIKLAVFFTILAVIVTFLIWYTNREPVMVIQPERVTHFTEMTGEDLFPLQTYLRVENRLTGETKLIYTFNIDNYPKTEWKVVSN